MLKIFWEPQPKISDPFTSKGKGFTVLCDRPITSLSPGWQYIELGGHKVAIATILSIFHSYIPTDYRPEDRDRVVITDSQRSIL